MYVETEAYLDFLRSGKASIRALLIGIDSYRNASLSPLLCAVSDGRKLEEVMRASTLSFPSSQLTGLYGTEDYCVTKQEVEQALDSIVNSSELRDTLVIYFSGHGQVDDRGELHLCLSNTDPQHLSATALSVKQMLNKLKSAAAGRQVVVMDACHSGSTIGQFGARSRGAAVLQRSPRDVLPSTPIDPTVAQKLTDDLNQYGSTSGRDFFALMSCESGQKSWEIPGFGGAFTHFLVEGVKGEAANPDGVIEMTKLFEYVTPKTEQLVKEQSLYAESQTPVHISAGRNKIIVGIASSTQHEDSIFVAPLQHQDPRKGIGQILQQNKDRYRTAFLYCISRHLNPNGDFANISTDLISADYRSKLEKHAEDWLLEYSEVQTIESECIELICRYVNRYRKDLSDYVYKRS
jgi:hypothetical protein